MEGAFFAMMARLRLINRWSLMRNLSQENVMEHSYQVALLSHALLLIRRKYYADERPAVDLAQLMGLALYHDAGEILTGDLPTPIKYQTEELRRAYGLVEEDANRRLLDMLPEDLRPDYAELLLPDLADSAWAEAHLLVKAADGLCAFLKCIEELGRGNREFEAALKQTHRKLKEMDLPELNHFLEHYLPSFYLSLDELQR